MSHSPPAGRAVEGVGGASDTPVSRVTITADTRTHPHRPSTPVPLAPPPMVGLCAQHPSNTGPGPTLGVLSRCRMTLWRLLVMWVSRLRARFQGLQIQWLSSPLGADGLARLCPGPTLLGYISPEPWQERDTQPPPGGGGRCHSSEVRGWPWVVRRRSLEPRTGSSRGLDPMAALGAHRSQHRGLHTVGA